ncbi:HD family phosphohydrolase [Tepidibacillus sp. HK-1]|uniref:HD family phosphohydrolase n=1 Tax=Tepidibacillus sp. HK-1 TaxID=1883407 RepID=UPI000853C36A|nr:HDIG domain-containing metalloprotein [Tepidibacillus sp. HK-1]GBF10146.1 7TM-HD extracellular [Tepidibacillus sp. HK-1]
MGKKQKVKWNMVKMMEGWGNHPSIRFFMYIGLGIIMYLLLIGQVIPETYELKEGQISQVTLTSPIRVENQWATELAKDKAAKSVPDQYTKDQNIVNDQISRLEQMFTDILTIAENKDLSKEEKEAALRDLTSLSFLDDALFKELSSLNVEKIKNIQYISKSTLDIVMNDGVNIKKLNEAFEEAAQIIQNNPFDNEDRIKHLANEMTKYFIKPNVFYNSDQTSLLREKAKSEVEPVIIKKDELIVKQGQYIDKEIYEKLKAAGLLKDTSTLWPYFGLLLFILLILLLLFFSIERMNPFLHQDNRALLLLFTIFILTFSSISILGLIGLGKDLLTSPKGYLAPVAFGVMLITLLINMKMAILSGVIFSIFTSMIFSTDQSFIFDFRYGFVALIGSAAGAFAIGRIKQRSAILKAGLVVSLFNVIGIAVIVMLTSQSYSLRQMFATLSYGAIGGFFSSVLTIGFLPFFEAVFGILSPTRLIELSNPNHPLLRKLLIETPGTYHHSVIVGNLAEAAAEAINANGLLARVGAYYHDLGKTKRPSFFIENQLNMENPHDKISPSLSKNIILAHPKDGVEMLKVYKIPNAIQDIAEQHHGTSLLKYFYHKASKDSEQPIPEVEYRYPGPKPQFKEAAIVGIADSVEAAVRSIKHPTNEIIEEMVRKIIKSKLDDGQLNECDLTLKELEIIAISMLETLKGIFHSRIEYPDDKDLEETKGARSS